MAHKLAAALHEMARVRQRCALKEANVYVRREHIHIAERHIAQACNRTAVVQDLPDFIPAASHHLKPFPRNRSQLASTLLHPRIDRWIASDSAVQSE
jgi:hypothetical protein